MFSATEYTEAPTKWSSTHNLTTKEVRKTCRESRHFATHTPSHLKRIRLALI